MNHNIDILEYSFEEWKELFKSSYDKNIYHAKAFFKAIYHNALKDDLSVNSSFVAIPKIAHALKNEYQLILPTISQLQNENDNIKFRLDFENGLFSESVIIKMQNYYTLCISSQTGCAHGCAFCATGAMDRVANLSTKHIVAQYMVSHFVLGKTIKNIVFMGMGEAMDNFSNVIKAIDLLVHPYGISLSSENITISTVGKVANIEKLHKLIEMDLQRAENPIVGEVMPTPYRNIKLAVSLNASNNEVRNKLMKINYQDNMQKLKEALKKIPLKRKHHDLFIEYVLIPHYNSDERSANELLAFLSDLPCVVNLIPYNSSPSLPFVEPSETEVDNFFKWLVVGGQVVRRRHRRGSTILAACGQLANYKEG